MKDESTIARPDSQSVKGYLCSPYQLQRNPRIAYEEHRVRVDMSTSIIDRNYLSQFELVTVRVMEPYLNSRHEFIRSEIKSARFPASAPVFDNEFPSFLH